MFSDRGEEIAIELPAGPDVENADVEAHGNVLEGQTRDAIVQYCESHGFNWTPVLELGDTDSSDVFDDDAWLQARHPVTGPERLVAAPWRVDGRRPVLENSAPKLGEGNDYVLRHVLQLDDETITARLSESGG